ncbi:MAG: glycyl-radical enzyme activating protein [Phocaeicola sp.]|uniref:glycyl-radical enzyme activating protein n=1 Tax=Phocaeicola sp. TaxID=2773926 RepID=UPI003FA18AD0
MALIFDIKRYAINDGPGIRTTIFIKGCPLHCIWCHNPESWSSKRQKIYKKTKCIGCKSCVDVCPMHAIELTPNGIMPIEGKCISCGMCTNVCPTTALEMCGKEWKMEDLMKEIEKERDIMQDSHGGVTLCGGEPLTHPDYALEILKELGKRGFHRTVDTTLYTTPKVVQKVMENCELFLVDLKSMDSSKHKFFTGVPNEQILNNITLLAEMGGDFFIRIPLIKGVNSDKKNIKESAEFLSSISWKRKEVNLLPYHDIGKEKHTRMWNLYNPEGYEMSTPTEAEQQHCIDIFARYGIKATVGG